MRTGLIMIGAGVLASALGCGTVDKPLVRGVPLGNIGMPIASLNVLGMPTSSLEVFSGVSGIHDYSPPKNTNYLTHEQIKGLEQAIEDGSKIWYNKDPGQDLWQSPEETARYNMGDCEDIAIAIAEDLDNLDIENRVVLGFYNPLEEFHAWNELSLNGFEYVIDLPNERGLMVKSCVKEDYDPWFYFQGAYTIERLERLQEEFNREKVGKAEKKLRQFQ